MERIRVGEFYLGNTVDITDPCYNRDVWCRMTTECKPGYYTGYADISDEGDWGKRVAQLSIYLDDKVCDDFEFNSIGNIGVDAGMAGFFNNKPDYKDDEWNDFLVESGVFKNEAEYNFDRNYYCIDKGIFSDSGYGDGGYEVLANDERTAFRIVFISDDEEEEE